MIASSVHHLYFIIFTGQYIADLLDTPTSTSTSSQLFTRFFRCLLASFFLSQYDSILISFYLPCRPFCVSLHQLFLHFLIPIIFISTSVRLCLCKFICLFHHLFFPSIHASFPLSIHPSIRQSIHPTTHLLFNPWCSRLYCTFLFGLPLLWVLVRL